MRMIPGRPWSTSSSAVDSPQGRESDRQDRPLWDPGFIKWDRFFLVNHNQTSRKSICKFGEPFPCNNGIVWWNGVIFFMTWDQGNYWVARKWWISQRIFCGTEVEPNARIWDSWPKWVGCEVNICKLQFLITGDESNEGKKLQYSSQSIY